MSTDFVTNKHIPFSKIKKFNYSGVKVDKIDESGDGVLLTDGRNYMWAFPNADFETIIFDNNKKTAEVEDTFHYEGVLFTRYAGNDPEMIIEAIESFFDVTLISEHEDEFDEIISKKQAVLKVVKS